MLLKYHEVDILETKHISGSTFLSLRQTIDCRTADGDDYAEVKLFGFTPGTSSTIRKLLYQVPDDTTAFTFESVLHSYPMARIVRVISHEPILSIQDREFIKQGLLGIDSIARRQLIRDGDSVYTDRYGMPVYGQNKLSLTGSYSDQDQRLETNAAWIKVEVEINDTPIYTTRYDD